MRLLIDSMPSNGKRYKKIANVLEERLKWPQVGGEPRPQSLDLLRSPW
jgi:hypothetical protein